MSFLSRLLPLQFPVRKSTRKRCHSRTFLEQLETRIVLASWVGQIGGVEHDEASSEPVMDSAGNIYVGGVFSATADFDLGPGTATLTSAGGLDAYIAKYSPDGSLQWARRFGGSLHDRMYSVRLDPATGRLFATGHFLGSADLTGDGVADQTSAGGNDIFVISLDPASGNTQWHKRVGGSGDDSGRDLAAAGGHVYVVGRFQNTVDFNPGAGTNSLTSAGKDPNRLLDGFVLKLTDQGNYVWAGQIGGSSSDRITSVIVDGGTLYVAGDFNGAADLNPSATVTKRTSNGGTDAFFASYSTAGTLNWVQTIGGLGKDGENWRLSGDTNSLYLSGAISETVDFDPSSGTTNLSSAGVLDGVIAKYSKASGALQWARRFGSVGYDTAQTQVVVNPTDGSLYLGGWFEQTVDFNPTSSGGELISAGGRDGVLLKLNASGEYLSAWRMGGIGNEGLVTPIGLIGNTIYAAGGFGATADFPTGHTLTSFGSGDGFLMALDDALPAPSPLLAAAVPARSVDQSLTASQYRPILAEAQRRWQAAGVNTAALSGLNVQVKNLGGTTLGLASGNTIWLDDNAAGWGWFVDSTPGNSSEFLRLGNQGEQQRMDLLTVVMHERGHLLGHNHDVEGVMAETLVAGVRRTDTEHDNLALVDQVFGHAVDHHTEGLLGTLLDDRLNSRGLWFKRRR